MAHLEDWHRRVGWSRGSMSRPSSPLFQANIHGIFLHKPELGTGSFFRAIASFEKGAFSFARLTEALHLQCTYKQAQSSVQGLSCLHSGTCTYEYSTLRCICTQQECNTLICSFPQFYHYGMMTIPCFLHSKKGLKRNNAIWQFLLTLCTFLHSVCTLLMNSGHTEATVTHDIADGIFSLLNFSLNSNFFFCGCQAFLCPLGMFIHYFRCGRCIRNPAPGCMRYAYILTAVRSER